MRILCLMLVLPFLVMCRSEANVPVVVPTVLVLRGGQSVAQLQAQPPPSGASVIVNGWRGGDSACPATTCPEDFSAGCPEVKPAYILTDTWLPTSIILLNGGVLNLPLTELLQPPLAWLLIVPPSKMPEYRVQLRGRLGDPAYAHCPFAEHIFVVEEVLQRSTEQPFIGLSRDPALGPDIPEVDVSDWQPWTQQDLGYTILTPPTAHVTTLPADENVLGGMTILFNNPSISLVVRVHPTPVYQDPMASEIHSTHLEGGTRSAYTQIWPASFPPTKQGPLRGFRQVFDHPREVTFHIWFEAGGHSYEFATTVQRGLDIDQPTLLEVTAIVNTFVVAAPQRPTPTPAIKQRIGAGPFLAQDRAWERLLTELRSRASSVKTFTLLEAALLSEATVRNIRPGACQFLPGHPEALWAFRVRMEPDEYGGPVVHIADATTGKYLCTTALTPQDQATLPVSPPQKTAGP